MGLYRCLALKLLYFAVKEVKHISAIQESARFPVCGLAKYNTKGKYMDNINCFTHWVGKVSESQENEWVK